MNKVLKLASTSLVNLIVFLNFANAQVSQEEQQALNPEQILTDLMEGNARYVAGTPTEQDIAARIATTSKGQYPKAVILSCLDSRVPVELVFDQGIGDIFVGRVAGNIENEDQIGSMEFAAKLAGSKLIMVLGHTSCGAVKGDKVVEENVRQTVADIREKSSVLTELEEAGSLKIVGAIYDLATGKVSLQN